VAARKRKRAHQYTVNYSEVQEVDCDGRLREVIVIEDTPTTNRLTSHDTQWCFSASYQPPIYSAPIRLELGCCRSSGLINKCLCICCALLRRSGKRDPIEEVRAPASKKLASSLLHPQIVVPPAKLWDTKINGITEEVWHARTQPGRMFALTMISAQAAKEPPSCDDKEGHYIIEPKRCAPSALYVFCSFEERSC